MTVRVWIAISAAGYPNATAGMALTKNDLYADYRTTHSGRQLTADGYRAVKATLMYDWGPPHADPSPSDRPA
jgi:hypothetical protein